MQKEVEKHFTRQELRRMAAADVGATHYPARVREAYAQDLLARVDIPTVRARGFRIVVDYGFSAASFVLPLVLGPLGVEVVSTHAFPTEPDAVTSEPRDSRDQVHRLVKAVGADFGALIDRAGERLYLVDELGRDVPLDLTLLLYLRLLGSDGRHGRLAFPITVTSQVDRLAEAAGLEVVRTPASLPALTKATAEADVLFGGAVGGGYVFPEFLPAYDAVASLAKLLELLAPVGRPLSELVGELPEPALVHHELPCPWSMKGLVMRVLNERLAGRHLDLLDGIKLFDERGWAQVLPDADEPILHVYAEGDTCAVSEELAGEMEQLIEEIEQGHEAPART
jgi:mannose-1-phosphate guanylyltransferase/phosphomannomutase